LLLLEVTVVVPPNARFPLIIVFAVLAPIAMVAPPVASEFPDIVVSETFPVRDNYFYFYYID